MALYSETIVYTLKNWPQVPGQSLTLYLTPNGIMGFFEWCGEEATLIIDHFEHDLGIRVNLYLVCDLILCRQCIKNEPHFHHMIIPF